MSISFFFLLWSYSGKTIASNCDDLKLCLNDIGKNYSSIIEELFFDIKVLKNTSAGPVKRLVILIEQLENKNIKNIIKDNACNTNHVEQCKNIFNASKIAVDEYKNYISSREQNCIDLKSCYYNMHTNINNLGKKDRSFLPDTSKINSYADIENLPTEIRDIVKSGFLMKKEESVWITQIKNNMCNTESVKQCENILNTVNSKIDQHNQSIAVEKQMRIENKDKQLAIKKFHLDMSLKEAVNYLENKSCKILSSSIICEDMSINFLYSYADHIYFSKSFFNITTVEIKDLLDKFISSYNIDTNKCVDPKKLSTVIPKTIKDVSELSDIPFISTKLKYAIVAGKLVGHLSGFTILECLDEDIGYHLLVNDPNLEYRTFENNKGQQKDVFIEIRKVETIKQKKFKIDKEIIDQEKKKREKKEAVEGLNFD